MKLQGNTYELPGLSAAVTIKIDEWGVPHIQAETQGDLYYAQGFNAARERLFQLDLWRRRGLGKLAAVLGSQYVRQDEAARLFLNRSDIDDEWNAYGRSFQQRATRFIDGVNEYIHGVLEGRRDLPLEFGVLGYLPEYWNPEDICRIRTHGRFGNAEQEFQRALVLGALGEEFEGLRSYTQPKFSVPSDLRHYYGKLSPEAMDLYRLAFAPVDLSGLGPTPILNSKTEEGSNNWVLSGERTASGNPILANDPHRAILAPSLRYLVHLSCDDFDVIGAGEPHLPGVSIGHNGSVAFGLTIFPIDQEDLYMYELHPKDPTLYRYRGTWIHFDVVKESIEVKESENETVVLRFSVHGPIVWMDEDNRIALGLRAAWLEPGMTPYLASLNYLEARDIHEFRETLVTWGAPGVNQVFADTSGNIGWAPAGRIPKRPNWDGSLPVLGNGEYEWDGYYEADELPGENNPQRGWIATANEFNLAEHNPNNVHVTNDWTEDSRARRLSELLSAKTAWTVEECMLVQRDVVSMTAREVLQALGGVTFSDSEAERLRLELIEWDGAFARESVCASIYATWVRVARERLIRHSLRSAGPVSDELRQTLIGRDHAPDPKTTSMMIITACQDRERREILASSLVEAERHLVQELGSDRSRWAWGTRNLARFRAFAAAPSETPELQQSSSVSRDGYIDTVGLMVTDGAGNQTDGASFSMVIEVGDWDRSLALNAPGQSGDPRSKHFHDLVERWGENKGFPLCYSNEMVQQHSVELIELNPLRDE